MSREDVATFGMSFLILVFQLVILGRIDRIENVVRAIKDRIPLNGSDGTSFSNSTLSLKEDREGK